MKKILALRPADSLTLVFLLCLTALTVIFSGKIPDAPKLLLIYSLLLLVQIALTRRSAPIRPENGSRLSDYLRDLIFPVIAVLVIFDSLEMIVHRINPKDIDPLLIRLDYLLFRGYPTVVLESIHTPVLTDVLQAAYSTYYFLPVALGLALKLRGRDHEFGRALFLILLCFYLSYVGYLLFPALGPRYAMNHLQTVDLGGFFIGERIQALLNRLEGIKRDAFPSGHTAVALVVLTLGYRLHRRFFFFAAPVVGMLVFSTVYCRYHYVVDVIGGVLLAALTFLLGERYYEYWERRNDPDR